MNSTRKEGANHGKQLGRQTHRSTYEVANYQMLKAQILNSDAPVTVRRAAELTVERKKEART